MATYKNTTTANSCDNCTTTWGSWGIGSPDDSNWNISVDTSTNTADITINQPQTISASASSPPARADGGQQCNESLKHSHEQKAVFHGLKSAYRMISSGQKGVVETQPERAARIAGQVGAAFLAAEGADYDRDRSEKHLVEKVLDRVLGGDDVDELEAGIEKAWEKVDNGNHKGGARVAIAAAEEYLGEEVW